MIRRELKRLGAESAFRHRGFALFWWARFLNTFATEAVSVAVGWQVYDLTHNPFDLGLVGLIQFAPSLILVLVTGAASDRFNRRLIFALCQVAEAVAVGGLLLFTALGSASVGLIFGLLAVLGVARAFANPAAQSLIPNLVPAQDLAGAIALSASSWQFATIVGPVAGGLLYGVGASAPYAAALAIYLMGATLILGIPKPAARTGREPTSWSTIVAGIRYVFHERIVLGAISLDLFAVLLGGAVALLPAYASDILDAGPVGLGFLRSAAGIGAIVTAVYLTVRPIKNHAGRIMFVSVALFGIATVVFGISRSIWLSVLALAVAGAADMISVYVRETLIQLWTPDAVRGRVSAVNQVFIGASNEVGEFRAGTVAAAIGLVPAVVIGGIGTVIVAAIWAWQFPELRRVRTLAVPDGRHAPSPDPLSPG
jgi:MFS family permease